MRFSTPFTMTFGALLLLGAGCSNFATPPAAPAAPAPATQPVETTSAPEPTSSSTTSTTSNPSAEPMTLAFPGVMPAAEVAKNVRIKTSLGDIVIALNPGVGPRAASNFVYLAKQGFYNGTIFHRVIPGFMIQGGDPTGTGRGGPGYQFQNDAVENLPVKQVTVQGRTMTAPVYEDGIVAMANAGRDTNGSQFFIMVADFPLDPDYSIFGKVVKGLDIAHKIADVARDGQDRPLEEVKMVSVTVE